MLLDALLLLLLLPFNLSSGHAVPAAKTVDTQCMLDCRLRLAMQQRHCVGKWSPMGVVHCAQALRLDADGSVRMQAWLQYSLSCSNAL